MLLINKTYKYVPSIDFGMRVLLFATNSFTIQIEET